MTQPLLSVHNLNIAYLGEHQDIVAVKDCSFEIHHGEILGLVGESGSGKSTVLHSIFRSLPPPGVIQSGKILLNGMDLLQLSETKGKALRWSEIALVVQSALNSLNPVHTILSHFEDSLLGSQWEKHPDKLDWIRQQLQLVDLPHSILSQYPHELSGGMRQRVVIALAIVLRPKLLIFDEPTTALDRIVERDIIAMLMKLQQELGFSGLFISHDIEIVKEISHRIAIMQHGKLLEICQSSNINTTAQHPYTQKLLQRESLHFKKAPLAIGEPLVAFQNISKTFVSPFGTSTHALKGISLKIHQGECVALVGGSGSGKSTIGKILIGSLTPSSGTLHWHRDVTPKKPFLFKKQPPSPIQMIFQNPFDALNNTKTIGQQLKSARDAQILSEILSQVGLDATSVLHKFPHELSGGERQRISIAKALLAKPKILVADEPTSMLDVSLRFEILQLLQKIQQDFQLSVVLITHDMNAARFLSDRCVVLCEGEVVESGTTVELFENPQHNYTQKLLAGVHYD